MALSAGMIARLTEELSSTLTGGRIDKIQQPEQDLLLLTVRSAGENRRLLIRAAGPNARIHLTAQNYENPAAAPMFCMLLRKHLTGARILQARQPGGDRLIVFAMESRNELGDRADLQLAVELLGRAANVILIDGEGRILDCLRRIPPNDRGGRALLPGLRYELPERPETALRPAAEELLPEGSISAFLDARYARQEKEELRRRRSQELVKSVRRMRDRQERKLALQREELRRTENMEDVRREAELLQANLYRVRRGDRVLECQNYYLDDQPIIRIGLDPTRTPQQNLAARFKEYRKLKGAREHLGALITDGGHQLDYLNSVLDELNRAETERDLEEIRAELQRTGILKAPRQRKTSKQRPTEPMRFESADGFTVLVGRNNAQNDELTLRTARRTDYWLHVKELHGSHVILCCEGREPSETALRYAAELAAYYSQARNSGRTAVDCTMVRHVKKPSGALPGRVIYTDYQTLIVQAGEMQ